MMKKIYLLLLLLFPVIHLCAQLREPVYLSQYSYGAGWALFYTDIVVGHINQDGVPDVIFSMAEGYQVGYGKIQEGRITFDMLPIDFHRYGWWYFAGQLVDYDLDGDEDYITTASDNFDFNRSFIMENEGGHLADTFRHAAPEFADKAELLFGKYNNDEVADLHYFVTSPPTSLHLQDGATGQLQPLPVPLSSGIGVNTGDFNKDGLMDFHHLVTNSPIYQSQTDNLYLNNGNYTFDHYETTGYLTAPDWGDFDGDGVDDLFTRPAFNSTLSYVFKSRLKTQNQAQLDTLFISPVLDERSHIVMDVTGDGTEDLIIFTRDSVFFCETDANMQFNIQRSAGIWQPVVFRQHPDLPPGTVLALDSGATPLLLRFAYSDTTGLVVEQNYNAFAPCVLRDGIYASPMASLDLDADGLEELCIGSDYAVAFSETQHDGTLAEQAIHGFFDEGSARGISSGDWNGDGHKDLFLNEGEAIYVATREPDSSLATRIYLTEGRLLDVHDFDHNGFSDLLIGVYDSVLIRFNENGALVSQEVLITHMPFPEFTVFDPDADGYPDVALSTDSTLVFMNDGTGHFTQSTLKINGKLAHSTLPDSPWLFTVLPQNIDGNWFYRTNLHRVLPDGQEVVWITGYAFLETVISNREAWLVNYDGDSIPDMLFNINIQNPSVHEWKALLVNGQEALYDILSVPQSFLLGAEDVAEDGMAEIVYVKSSQVFLENGLPSMVNAIDELPQKALEVKLYPNPLSADAQWTIAYENDFTGTVSIELFHSDGRFLGKFEREKNSRRFISSFSNFQPASGMVLIRVTDGEGAAVKKLSLIR